MTLRSFWRIIFDVVDQLQPDGTLEAVPRVSLELVIWDTGSWTRLGRSVTNIPVVDVGTVTFADGVATFFDGYLTGGFHRNQLEQELLALISGSLESFDFGDISNPFGDENISIIAQVNLPDDGTQQYRPIFYMDQPTSRGSLPSKGLNPTDGVRLVEKIDAGGLRSIDWSISGDNHKTAYPFQINDRPDNEPPRGWHRVRVIQDVGTSSHPYVYEILADSMPLDNSLPANPSSHRFYSEPVDFYIGGMPDRAGGVIGLHGEISFLEFDPNNSCGNCAG